MESKFVNSLRNAVENIHIHEGVPNFLELAKDKDHRLIILDDLGDESYGNAHFKKLLTRISHHSEISVILVNQNFFEAKEKGTGIARNMSTVILFNHRSDPTHIALLSKRFCNSPSFFAECYRYMNKNLPSTAQHYLCIDFETRSQLPHELNCRSQILSSQTPLFFLHPK